MQKKEKKRKEKIFPLNYLPLSLAAEYCLSNMGSPPLSAKHYNHIKASEISIKRRGPIACNNCLLNDWVLGDGVPIKAFIN